MKDNNHAFRTTNSFLSGKSVESRSPPINVTETKPGFVCLENWWFEATFMVSKFRKSPKKCLWQGLAYSCSIPLWRAHTDTTLPTRAFPPPPTAPSQLPIFSKRNQSGGRGAFCGPNKRAKVVRTLLFGDGGAVAQTARLSGLCSNEPTGLCCSLATVTHGWGESWKGGGLWGHNFHRNWTFHINFLLSLKLEEISKIGMKNWAYSTWKVFWEYGFR